MAGKGKVDQNEWAVITLRELADEIERGICRVESQSVENSTVAFEQGGWLVCALSGKRRMEIEWFDPMFDKTDMVSSEILADGFGDDPAHLQLMAYGLEDGEDE